LFVFFFVFEVDRFTLHVISLTTHPCLGHTKKYKKNSWGYECAGALPGVYSRLSHWATFLFIEKTVCQYSVWAPEYLDCLKWTESPTLPPTSGPTITPRPTTPPPTVSPEPTHSPSYIPPPSSEPTTEALREFLYGTSTGHSSQGQTEDGSYFDDAFFEINGDNGNDPNAVNGATSNADNQIRSSRQSHAYATLLVGILSTINIFCC
jgi:hypothetical protein